MSVKKPDDRDFRRLRGGGEASPREAAGQKVKSADILGNHTELQIDHNGEVYRLRKTRLGKLILTK